MQEWEHWIITDDPHAMTHPGQTNRLALKGTLIAVGSLLTIGSLCVPIGATMMSVPIAIGATLLIGKKNEDASIGGDTKNTE